MPSPIATSRSLELDAIRRGATRLSLPLTQPLTPQELSTDTIATVSLAPTASGATSKALAPRISPLSLPVEDPEFEGLLQEHLEVASQETNLPLQTVKNAFSQLTSAELANAINSWQATSNKLFPTTTLDVGSLQGFDNQVDAIFRLLLEAELTWMLDDLRYSTHLRQEARTLKTQYLAFMAAVAEQYRKEASAIMKWGLIGSVLQMASAAVPGIQREGTLNKLLPTSFTLSHTQLIKNIASKSSQEFVQKIMTEGGKSFANMGTSDAKKHEATRTLEQAQAEVVRNFWDYVRQQLQQEKGAMTSKEEKVYQLLQQFLHLVTQG